MTCQRAGSCELGLHVVEAGACLGDCSLQRVDLLPADAGIDVVAVRGCRCQRGTRLVCLCRQLNRGKSRQDIARTHVGAFPDPYQHKLAVHLRLDPDFGRPHDANDRGRRFGATSEGDQNARDEHDRDRNDGGAPSFVHVSVLS